MTRNLLHTDVLRKEFPATSSAIYMDVANQGLISRTARSSVDQHLDNRMNGINDEAEMMELVERARFRFAEFIGAATDEIALTKNASEGINIIGNAIEWHSGDNVVLCRELEHANNILPWLQLRDKHGIELRIVEAENGAIPSAAFERAIDSRTRIATISTVTMVPGFKTVIAPLSAACRRFGTFLLADASQSVGILHTDVNRLGVDGLVASAYKGLMGLYGLGFLYCRREWADRLSPAYLARFSVDLGDAPESAPIFDSVKLRAGAPRFEIGHYNFPGVIAAYTSMGQLMEIGTVAIEQNVTAVARRLASGLFDLGLPVCGGEPGEHIGSIVAVGSSNDAGWRDGSFVEALHQHLTRRQVIASIRRGMLRFSLHLYNTADEADQVVDIARVWQH